MRTYKKILVAVDGSKAAEKGLREALRLAGSKGTRLTILNVVNTFPAFASLEGGLPVVDLLPALREGGKKVLARARATAQKAGVRPAIVMREITGGPTADAIVREARKQRADVLVLGTHGRRGMSRVLLGSDAEQVVRTSPVPVLLVRA